MKTENETNAAPSPGVIIEPAKQNNSAAIEIFIVVEDGQVREIGNLPDNLKVTVIDYDIKDVAQEQLSISPIDGELCVINKW